MAFKAVMLKRCLYLFIYFFLYLFICLFVSVGHRCDCLGHNKRVWFVQAERTQRCHHTSFALKEEKFAHHKVGQADFFSFCSNLRSRVIACLLHGQNLEGKKKERELRKCFVHFHKHLKLLVLLPSFTPARRTAL